MGEKWNQRRFLNTLAPFVNDLESFNLLTACGDGILCSRSVNPDWFALAIGGYGLFGIVTSLQLRLMRRVTVRREVRLEIVEAIPAAGLEQRLVSALPGSLCPQSDFGLMINPILR